MWPRRSITRLSNTSIGLRLFIQNAVGGLGMVALVVLVVVVTDQNTDGLRRVDAVTERTIDLNRELVTPLGRLRRESLAMVAADGRERRAADSQPLMSLMKKVNSGVERWRATAEPRSRSRAARIATAWAAYRTTLLEARTELVHGNRAAARRIVTGAGQRRFTALRDLLADTMTRLKSRTNKLHERAIKNAVTTQRMAIAIAGVTALALAFAGWVLAARLRRPVNALTAAMRRLAAGDLDVSVPARERGDEIGGMARAVQVFQDNARERERLRAEHAEAERERGQILEILENTPDVIGMSTPDGTVLYINAAGERHFEQRREALRGRPIEWFHPDWVGQWIRNEAIPAARAGGIWHAETALLARDGTEIPVSQVVFAHFDADGAVVRLSTIMRDISERKEMERTLVAARDEADAANAAKTRFLSTMSHELRTPLNAINGMAEIIRDRLLGDDVSRYADYADDIRRSGGHLLELVNDLLDMSRLESGRYDLGPAWLDTDDMVRGCIRMMEPRTHANGARLTVDGTAPALYADERAVRQVILNLLSNAVKFAGRQGQVEVTMSRTDSGGLALAVRDTGPGIASHDLERVMRPFEKSADRLSSDHQEGTGLGLAITRQIMTLHDGDLYLDSTPGEGTVATAVFPPDRVEGDAASQALTTSSA